MKSPLLSDYHSIRYHYKPGDRILARISHDVDIPAYVRIVKAVQKSAGEELRVIVVNCLRYKVLWKHADAQQIEALVSKDDIDIHQSRGVVNLNCSVTDIKEGDELLVLIKEELSDLKKSQVRSWFKNWAGVS